MADKSPAPLTNFPALILALDELEADLSNAIGDMPQPQDDHPFIVYAICSASCQHGQAIRHLVSVDQRTSALSLMRPQVEALLRALWVSRTKDNTWAAQFLESDKGKRDDRFPKRLDKLLDDIRDSGDAQTASMYRSYLDAMESALHEYTHGGRMLIRGAVDGFREEAIEELLVHSIVFTVKSIAMIANTIDDKEAAVERLGQASAKYEAQLTGVRQWVKTFRAST